MTFSEFLNFLHTYIGVKIPNQDFIPFIISLIMHEPLSEKEIQDDNNLTYYPYNDLDNEKDFLNRIYNGSKFLPKTKAKIIKKHYDSSAFIKIFDDLSEDTRHHMCNFLIRNNISCSVESLPNICEKIIFQFIEEATNGNKKIDTTLIGNGKETTIPEYTDFDLKDHYGIQLLSETNQHCPNDGCLKPLYINSGDKYAFNYTIVQINPNHPRHTIDNLIALCPECASKYMLDTTPNKIERMENIKLRLSSYKDAFNSLDNIKLVDGIERVLHKISEITLTYNTSTLNYTPTNIKNKMDGTNFSLYIKIQSYINHFYIEVESIFKQLELEGQLNYEMLCQQIKYQYTSLSQQGLTQCQIFNQLVTWFSEITNEDTTPCEVVVSFFVQKCEVFNDISK